jgi:hypothetical protein
MKQTAPIAAPDPTAYQELDARLTGRNHTSRKVEPTAYIVGCEQYCPECTARTETEAALFGNPFAAADEPYPVFPDEAIDYPLHCAACARLIDQPLTDEGARYLATEQMPRLWRRHKRGDRTARDTWIGYRDAFAAALRERRRRHDIDRPRA